MKIYKLNNIQKRQQQQKLTNMTSNFQYKKSLWTSTWHKKKLLSSICISHDDFEYMWWKLAVESRKSSLSALDFIFSYIYICSNASINLQPQIILINYSQYHKVVYKYQSYWWTVNKSYLWRIIKTKTSIMI